MPLDWQPLEDGIWHREVILPIGAISGLIIWIPRFAAYSVRIERGFADPFRALQGAMIDRPARAPFAAAVALAAGYIQERVDYYRDWQPPAGDLSDRAGDPRR